MSLLYALTGSFRQARRQCAVPGAAGGADPGQELPAAKNKAPTLGLAERPLGPARWGYFGTPDLYRAILEGRTLPGARSARLRRQHADGPRRRAIRAQGLETLEFYAHSDLFMNPTAEMADIVLPVASAFEREALKIGFEISPEAQSLIQLRPGGRRRPGEARPDTDIIFDLAGSPRPWRAVLERRYRCRLPPPACPHRRQPRSSCAQTPGGVRVPLQTRHAKYAEPDAQGHAVWLCHALAQGRILSRRPFSTTATRHRPTSRSRRSVRWRGPTWRRASR